MKREFVGLIIIFILGVFVVVYNSNLIGSTSTSDINQNINKIPEADAIGILNGNVSKTSDGDWNLTFGVFTQERMKYMAVSAVWYDSSGNVISKNLIWNQSISDYDKTYPASTVAHMKNDAIPTKIEILYDYIPLRTNNETQAVYTGNINGTSIKWTLIS